MCSLKKKKKERKGKKETQMEGKGEERGEKAEPTRPRDPGPGRGCARWAAGRPERAHPSSGTPRAAQAEQVGKSVRLARAGLTPSLQRGLPGAQTRLAPRQRGQTCRTRRSTFLKAVRPPYVAQCPRGLPAAGQWPSARVPSPSAAGCPRSRPGGDCSGARRPPG